MNVFRLPAIRTVTVVVLLSGCGEHELAPVSGVVTLDGKPLVRGVVNFQPMGGENENPGPGSTGITDEKGRFVLKLNTPEGSEGALVGEHRVSISSRNAEGTNGEKSDPRMTVELVPSRYNVRSILTYPVPAEGTDKADFVLTTPD